MKGRIGLERRNWFENYFRMRIAYIVLTNKVLIKNNTEEQESGENL